jgi:hypothetical protein
MRSLHEQGVWGVFAGLEGSGDGTDFRKLSRSETQFLAGFGFFGCHDKENVWSNLKLVIICGNFKYSDYAGARCGGIDVSWWKLLLTKVSAIDDRCRQCAIRCSDVTWLFGGSWTTRKQIGRGVFFANGFSIYLFVDRR